MEFLIGYFISFLFGLWWTLSVYIIWPYSTNRRLTRIEEKIYINKSESSIESANAKTVTESTEALKAAFEPRGTESVVNLEEKIKALLQSKEEIERMLARHESEINLLKNKASPY